MEQKVDDDLNLHGDDMELELLSDAELQSIHDAVRRQDQFRLEEAEIRNVIMVGRSRSGKSTAINVLRDPCYTPEALSIFSDTFNPKFRTFALRAEDNKTYTLNLIDTPGLFEVTADAKDARDNKILLDTISTCLEFELTCIHAVIVFASFDNGLNPHDVTALKTFLELFAGPGVTVAFCITRADKHPQNWQAKIKDEISRHDKLSQLLGDDVTTLFMGFHTTHSTHNTTHNAPHTYTHTHTHTTVLILCLLW
jgi:GTP-binding protein EngB required for normal cell division